MYFNRFEPISLRVERVGPFDQEFHIDFMKQIDIEDHESRPAQLFLLASQNAKGKTTLLEAIALAMSNLSGYRPEFRIKEDIAKRKGRIQFDIKCTIISDKNIRAEVILSLIAGKMIYEYLPHELEEYNASDGQIEISSSSDGETITPKGEIAKDILETIRLGVNDAFQELFNEDTQLPTTLYFTADRGISRPPSDDTVIAKPSNLHYQAFHLFGREEGDWRNSIDNLFCWFTWLSAGAAGDDDSLFDRARNTVNDIVLDDPDKRLKIVNRDPPEPYIEAGGKYHRLDRLSSGELSRLQIILRTAALMTAHTILIIDEIELHLHPVWQHKLFDSLVKLIERYPGLKIIYTTHSKELVERGINFSTRKQEKVIASHHLIKGS